MNKVVIKKIIQYYLSHFYLLIIYTILAVIGGYVYFSKMQTPMYSSFTTVLVVNRQEGEANVNYNLNHQLVNTYTHIIKNSDVLKNTKANLKLKMSESSLANSISVTSIDGTEIIKIQVVNEDPHMAMIIANEVTKNFITKVNEIYNLQNLSLLLEAQESKNPYNMNIIKNTMITGLAGFTLAFVIIFYLYYFDSTIKSGKDIEELTAKPVLGNVVFYKDKTKKKPKKGMRVNELVLNDNPKSSFAESINTIRTNLAFSDLEGTKKTFLVTSSTPSEGKSFLVANLALSFANNDKKVLIIDADLRRGRQHHIFNISQKDCLGYSKMILNVKDSRTSNYIYKTKYKNISVLPCGNNPPSPSELLSSENNKKLLDKLKKKYDYIFIDCPPALGFSDAIIMSKFSDLNIIVATSHRTKLESLMEVKEQFEKVGSEITGFIINKEKESSKKYGYYGYYY